MKYRLVSLGKLRPGVNEQDALPLLMKATKLEELAVRKKLLAGKKLSLLTSTDVDRIAATKGRFEKIGLAVEVVEVPEPSEATKEAPKTFTKPKRSILKRITWAFAIVITFLAGGAGGLWYWLYLANSPSIPLQQALITDSTAAIVNLDLAQATKLETLLNLNLDPLLTLAEEESLLADIIQSRKSPSVTLNQAYLTFNAQGEEQAGHWLAVVTGEFEQAIWQSVFAKHYNLTKLNSGVYELNTPTIVKDHQCLVDEEQPKSPSYASFAQGQLFISNSANAITDLQGRLAAPTPPNAEWAQWQSFRERKLFSAVVFSPTNSARALPGLMGLVGSQMAQSVPHVSGLALSAQVDVQVQGVSLQASVLSTDLDWNTTTAGLANNWLSATKGDTNITSQAMSALMDRLSITPSAEAVTASLPIGRRDIDNLKSSVENTVASLFGGSMTFSNDDEGEVIETNPVVYNRGINLNALPSYDQPNYFGEPLLIEGAFAFDAPSLTMNDDGFLTLAINAKAALPELDNSNGLSQLFQYALTINDVVNRQGETILRDERCVDPYEVIGALNHQPEDNGHAFSGTATVDRRLRLAKGTQVSDIDQVSGQYSLSYPRKVQTFSVPMRAGATIEFAGTSFELISLGARNARYKLTGNVDNFMEIRGLNANGDVLRKSFSTRSGKFHNQSFQGDVKALQVFIANGFDTVTQSFTLRNIFEPTEEKPPAHPFVMSYANVQRAKWNLYQFIDMRLVKPTPEKWYPSFESGQRAIGNKAWPGVKLFVTHNPEDYSPNPWAHLVLPLWGELSASMSALSYQLAGDDQPEQFVPVMFPYRGSEATLQMVKNQSVRGQPFGLINFYFDAGLDQGEPLNELAGELTLRLPQALESSDESFNNLWQTKEFDGIQVQLESVDRGSFAGYNFRIKGELNKLIAVHGMDDNGNRVAPTHQSFNNGSWNVVLPFDLSLNTLRVVTAEEQDEFELAFEFK